MDYRLITIAVKDDEPTVLPDALLVDGYVTIQSMTSASDPKPRTFHLRCMRGIPYLLEVTPS